jgi:hypothetical protein
MFLFFYFNDKVSREEHKIIYSGLGVSGMAFFNQGDLQVFYQDWPNPSLRQARISKEDLKKPAAYSHLPGTSDPGLS